jgi:hypothetical protein
VHVKVLKLEEPTEHVIDNAVHFAGKVRPVLSRRKARKLAYRYKGSSRGDRYRAFLAGQLDGFEVHGKGLVRTLKILRRSTQAFHMASTSEAIRRQPPGIN